MVSPLQTMLGTLLSNVLLLIGGFTMAFYTSWRLSILAFCTIGPIMHVTQVYAQWSQWLYRQIYAALAAANGIKRTDLALDLIILCFFCSFLTYFVFCLINGS